jgi:hypothetical protein
VDHLRRLGSGELQNAGVTEPRPSAIDSGASAVGARYDALGFERGTLTATLVVLAVLLLYTVGLPAINALIPPDEGGYATGAKLAVSVATPSATTSAAFLPAPGWRRRESGAGKEILERGTVTLTLAATASRQRAAALEVGLEDRVRRESSAVLFDTRQAIETTDSAKGVGARFVSTLSEGWVFAFARRGAAVTVLVIGAAGSLRDERSDEVLAMVRSIRFT